MFAGVATFNHQIGGLITRRSPAGFNGPQPGSARQDALCPEPGCGQPTGTSCTYALCPGRRAAVSPSHATPISPEAH